MITSDWKWKVTSGPATEPLSSTEVKNYLKIDVSTDDDLIAAQIKAARRMVESYTGLALISQTIEQKFDRFPLPPQYRLGDFPTGGALILIRYPLISVSSVAYTDTAGDSQTLSTDIYLTDSHDIPARLYLKYAQVWPDTYQQPNAVTVTYTAGYANAAAVPEDVKQAMYMMIADMYENRTDYVKRLPTAAEYLLNPYRVQHL